MILVDVHNFFCCRFIENWTCDDEGLRRATNFLLLRSPVSSRFGQTIVKRSRAKSLRFLYLKFVNKQKIGLIFYFSMNFSPFSEKRSSSTQSLLTRSRMTLPRRYTSCRTHHNSCEMNHLHVSLDFYTKWYLSRHSKIIASIYFLFLIVEI